MSFYHYNSSCQEPLRYLLFNFVFFSSISLKQYFQTFAPMASSSPSEPNTTAKLESIPQNVSRCHVRMKFQCVPTLLIYDIDRAYTYFQKETKDPRICWT